MITAFFTFLDQSMSQLVKGHALSAMIILLNFYFLFNPQTAILFWICFIWHLERLLWQQWKTLSNFACRLDVKKTILEWHMKASIAEFSLFKCLLPCCHPDALALILSESLSKNKYRNSPSWLVFPGVQISGSVVSQSIAMTARQLAIAEGKYSNGILYGPFKKTFPLRSLSYLKH